MKLLLAPFLLTSALLLTGCATTSGIAPSVSPKLLTCAAEPASPKDSGNSRQVANYIVDLHEAHADCSSKLGAVRKVLTNG